MKKHLLSILLAVLLVLMPIGSAWAQDGELPSPQPSECSIIQGPNGETYCIKTFERFDQPRVPARVLASYRTLASGGCSAFEMGVNMSDRFGNLLLSYAQRIDWCYDGTNVTWVTHSHIPTVYGIFIRYNGLVSDGHSGGVGSTFYNANSQADFCQFVPGFGCTWYVYPWVNQYVYGTGGTWGTAGY